MQIQFLGLAALMGLLIQPVLSGGNHQATVYTSLACQQTYNKFNVIVDESNFGCNNTACIPLDRSGNSVFLKQETTDEPRPIAYLYPTIDCSGHHDLKAVIKNELEHCTANKLARGILWKSVRVECGCH